LPDGALVALGERFHVLFQPQAGQMPAQKGNMRPLVAHAHHLPHHENRQQDECCFHRPHPLIIRLQASSALLTCTQRRNKTKGPNRGLGLLHFWSGKRVSNSRPQPWQGCALPTELFPHCLWRRDSESNRGTRLCRPLHNHSAIAPVTASRSACSGGKPCR